MNKKEMTKLIKVARSLAKPFRVTDGDFRLKDIDPGDTLGLPENKPRAKEALPTRIEILAELQDRLSMIFVKAKRIGSGEEGLVRGQVTAAWDSKERIL